MSGNKLATVEFHGQHLSVITGPNGEHLVAMKPICENIELQWEAQYKRIKRHPVLSSTMSIMDIQMAGDDQRREVVCLPLDYLNGWLFGVDTNRVKPEIRPRLIQYQRECFHVLAAYWQQGEVTNPRKAKKPKAIAGALTEEQQSIIRALVKNHLETLPKEKQGAAARKCWGSLSKSFACKSYKDIPAEQFSEAVSLLSRRFLEGEFLGKEPEPKPANTLLPEAQAKEINERLNRLFFLFHPFSDPFADVHGIQRALRGLHPKLGMDEPSFRQVLKRP